MNGLLHAAREVQGFLREHEWPFCFIGGIALLRWGEPRLTQDIDVCILTGFDDESRVIAPLLQQFKPRIADAEQFALENRVLLLQTADAVGIDISLGALPFEEAMVQAASEYDFGNGVQLRTCSAEHLIVMKAFADRPRDWSDVETVITRHCPRLDWKIIMDNLEVFSEVKQNANIMEKTVHLRDMYCH